MKPSSRILLGGALALAAIVIVKLLIGDSVVALLTPAGPIAAQEKGVIFKMAGLMSIIAVPMLFLMYWFAWRYRADNKKAVYDPDRPTSVRSELLLWAIPAALVAVMWTVVWGSTHALDPFNAVASAKKPITIQVVALQWKWLFIYPEQDVATVGYVELPADTPVHFELTADGPMSSFWIPQLGSQIYAMASMTTQLNLIAKQGEYAGRDTEINGQGYEGMTFTAKSVPQDQFDAWVQSAKRSPLALDAVAYEKLSVPSRDDQPTSYSSVKPDLFDAVMKKFTGPLPAAAAPAQPPQAAPVDSAMPGGM